MQIDPWSSNQSTDYDRIVNEFGLAPFTYADRLVDPPALIRRGVVFAHRGFDLPFEAMTNGERWGVLTGLMPSGPMHLGHKLVFDQAAYYQSQGADVTITVADLEAFVARGMSLKKAQEIAVNNYIRNYIALGLTPERLNIYFQSRRRRVTDLGWQLAARATLSKMQAIYGFEGKTNIGHLYAPFVQAADILHVQDKDRGGARPIVVPVGIDQEPHIRLTRELADATRTYRVQMHRDKKLGEVLAVFVGNETDAARALDAAQYELAHRGLRVAGRNDNYRALYLHEPASATSTVDRILARLEQSRGEMGFISPAATYHRFMGGLDGGKMSSSRPESHIALDEDPDRAAKKLDRAQTGGRGSVDEQRRLGGQPDACAIYEAYVYHLAPDDKELTDIRERCRSGALLCGECKAFAKERIRIFLRTHQEKCHQTEHLVEAIAKEAHVA